MQDIQSLIRKKLNKWGLKKKFDERLVLNYAAEFLKKHLKKITAQPVSYFYGNLIIEVKNAAEANELHFFEEELKYFLEQKGYKIKKIRIVS